MPKGNRYRWIFNKLDRLTDGIKEFASKPGNYKKLSSNGFMDLIVECISENVISLTHYYRQNGDLIPDPDMTIRIHYGMAEALTFQDYNSLKRVYTGDGYYSPALKKDLNKFLDFWLTNLKRQGFYK